MIGVLRADLLKLRKRWLFYTLVLVLAVLMGLVAAILLVVPRVSPDAIPGLPELTRADALTLGAQQAIGQTWFPLILAVVFLGGEVTTPIWASELTRESRRWIHLVSKLVILTIASWLVMLLATAVWAAIATFLTEGAGLTVGEWVGIIWKSAAIQFTWTAIGLGSIALIRSTGISIGIALAFSFFEGLGALWEPYRNVSLTTSSTALMGNVGADMSGGFGIGVFEPMAVGHAIAVVVGWGIIGVAMAVVGLQFRDP